MRTVVVVDYDSSWPQHFVALRAPIVRALGELAIAVEHVGSTAVPGLAAKPVIDIDVVVREPDVAAAIARLKAVGYEHLGDRGVPQREAFRAPPGSIAHHLYVCPSTSAALANHLVIRDHLRESPSAAREYGDLKKRLALQHPDDIDAYVEGKTGFLTAILKRHGFSSELIDEIEQLNRRPRVLLG